MAVYTRFNRWQLQELEDRLGQDFARDEAGAFVTEELSAGTSDSKHVVSLQDGTKLMVTIHETPDVNITNGQSAEEAAQTVLFAYFLSHEMDKGVADAHGNAVNVAVPQPLLWDDHAALKKPYGVMEFPSAVGPRDVEKAISVVPFYEHSITPEYVEGQASGPDASYVGGRALAAIHHLGEGFEVWMAERPERFLAKDHFNMAHWQDQVDHLLSDAFHHGTSRRIGEVLRVEQGGQAGDKNWQQAGRNMMLQMRSNIEYLADNWDEKTADLPRGMVHGDYFWDNILYELKEDALFGQHHHTMLAKGYSEEDLHLHQAQVIDFGAAGKSVLGAGMALAINAWGTHNDDSKAAFLRGYDEVLPVTPKLEESLYFLRAVGAQYIGLMRAFKLANMQEGQNVDLRSPAEPTSRAGHYIEKDKAGVKFLFDRTPKTHEQKLADERDGGDVGLNR